MNSTFFVARHAQADQAKSKGSAKAKLVKSYGALSGTVRSSDKAARTVRYRDNAASFPAGSPESWQQPLRPVPSSTSVRGLALHAADIGLRGVRQ